MMTTLQPPPPASSRKRMKMKVKLRPAVRKQQSRHSWTNLSKNNVFRTKMSVKIKN